MTVYVDDSRAPVGPYNMARFFADSDKELHALASAIGLSPAWSFPLEGDDGAHYYQVSPGLREQALRSRRGLEARPVTKEQASAMLARRRVTGALGDPTDAIAWLQAELARRQPQPTAQA